MATIPKKIRVASNPHRGASGSRPQAAAKRSNMAKTKKRKKAANGSAKHHRKNTTAVKHHRRRRNPGLGATLGTPKELLTGGLSGLVSAVATRQIPQLVLGAGNTGWEGYLANAVTAVAMTWGLGAFMGPSAARGALIGGSVILLDRVLSEQISPIGPYLKLSGVGDANAYSKLGTIRPGFYTHPGLQNPDGSMYVPSPYTDAAVAEVMARYPQIAAPLAAAAGKMGAVNPSALRRHSASGMLMSSRFQGRFNQ